METGQGCRVDVVHRGGKGGVAAVSEYLDFGIDSLGKIKSWDDHIWDLWS